MGVLDQEPTPAEPGQRGPTSALSMRRATPCLLCGGPIPHDHKYLCTMCGDEGAAIAAKALNDERRERARNGAPLHGGATHTDPTGKRTEYVWKP